MELLIAILIALGVIASEDASKYTNDSNAVNELIEKNNISQKQIDNHTAIVELEDDDL